MEKNAGIQSKFQSAHSTWAAGPHPGTPDTNTMPMAGPAGQRSMKKELLATTYQ